MGVKPASAKLPARAHKFVLSSRTCRAASSGGSPRGHTYPLATGRPTKCASISAERVISSAIRREIVDLPAPGAPVMSKHACPPSSPCSAAVIPAITKALQIVEGCCLQPDLAAEGSLRLERMHNSR